MFSDLIIFGIYAFKCTRLLFASLQHLQSMNVIEYIFSKLNCVFFPENIVNIKSIELKKNILLVAHCLLKFK